ncbi:MAG: SH3 domain-containing protein [Vulcanimicrobiota bacterium]
MGSWSKKIYLSFWITLVFVTVVGALWLPQILDQGKESSIKELEAAPQLDFSDEAMGQVVTRFPTRPFLDSSTNRPTQPPPPQDAPAVPSASTTASGPGGLPTRHVPGVSGGEAIGDRVTTRAYLRGNSSVFSQPQTTAKILGRVGTQTKVRWLASAGEGWEEILLKDGRSAYVQSPDLSFSADAPGNAVVSQTAGDGPDVNALPATVESFLELLSRQDLLRAETLLSPQAPRLAPEALGPLSPYVGAPPEGRVHRIEQIGGGQGGHRRVRVVYGPDLLHEASTLWEWDRSQGRWMLVSWG